MIETKEIIYHANAWAGDKKFIHIISKQQAFQKHDEKTRNKTPVGEKPELEEYLVMFQLCVMPTTDASHGNTLGLVTHVIRSYCAACKAGCEMCNNKSGSLYMQFNHWGELVFVRGYQARGSTDPAQQ